MSGLEGWHDPGPERRLRVRTEQPALDRRLDSAPVVLSAAGHPAGRSSTRFEPLPGRMPGATDALANEARPASSADVRSNHGATSTSTPPCGRIAAAGRRSPARQRSSASRFAGPATRKSSARVRPSRAADSETRSGGGFGRVEDRENVRGVRRLAPVAAGKEARGVAVLSEPEQHEIEGTDVAERPRVRRRRLRGAELAGNRVDPRRGTSRGRAKPRPPCASCGSRLPAEGSARRTTRSPRRPSPRGRPRSARYVSRGVSPPESTRRKIPRSRTAAAAASRMRRAASSQRGGVPHRVPPGGGHSFRTAWPPNCCRIAASSLSANESSSRERSRSSRASVITGAGTSRSIASCTVQRPSPESATYGAMPSSFGVLPQRRGGEVEQPRAARRCPCRQISATCVQVERRGRSCARGSRSPRRRPASGRTRSRCGSSSRSAPRPWARRAPQPRSFAGARVSKTGRRRSTAALSPPTMRL